MPYHTLDSLMEDPHLREVDFFETLEHPTEGRIINMNLPNKLSRGARTDFHAAPKIGQHSVDILRELGYDETEVNAMVAQRVTLDGRIAKSQQDR
jgi:crotonobetainyl-CoA:carnitine CoA-transferase CaiB-like acyl-CoA transferase